MKKIIIFVLMLLLICSSVGCIGEFSNIELKLTEDKEERQLNDNQVELYLDTFGEVKKVINKRYIGIYTTTHINGVSGDNYRSWIRAYGIRAPFMEKSFEVWVDNRNHEIFGTNFYEVLSNDTKFQHFYSEWVKKQVGIEDENVELEFKGALKSSAWVGEKPYIEFDKITDLDYLEEDICKNTHNLYLHTVVIDKFNLSSVNEVLELVKNYEKLLKPYVFSDGDNVLWFGVKLNDLVNDKEDPFSYGILFDYNKNEKKYYKYYENRSVENNKSEYIPFE